MKIPVRYLSFSRHVPAKDYWDMTMLGDMLDGKFARDPNGFVYEETEDDDWMADGGVIVFPGRAQVNFFEKLQRYITGMKWVVLMVTGDEESVFPFENLVHKKIHIYVMSPRRGERFEGTSFLGTGYSPAVRALPTEMPERTQDFFFAGQITHERRTEMAESIVSMIEDCPELEGVYVPTESFTAGLSPADYILNMAHSKVAYCPSGPETPDSFRLFEALESGCVPIVDTRVQSSKDNSEFGDDYWEFFFGEIVPFPVIREYDNLRPYTKEVLDNWDELSVKVGQWWNRKKYEMAVKLSDVVADLSGYKPIQVEQVTVLVPTSPIASHPDTSILQETLTNTLKHFNEPVQTIIMADGVRDDFRDYEMNYLEYLSRVLWMARQRPILVLTHDEHEHQARMTREALEYVRTPTILFVEHDAPLVPDYDFDFERLTQPILKGEANVIRFHHEALVLDVHRHLMLEQPTKISGIELWKTRQWSQRPHLASTAFYRTMLTNYFDPEARTMIEDVMHGIVDSYVEEQGIMAWYNFRVWMYHPGENENIKRSYHLDARAGDLKVINDETVEDI